jgi:hypothetical protein
VSASSSMHISTAKHSSGYKRSSCTRQHTVAVAQEARLRCQCSTPERILQLRPFKAEPSSMQQQPSMRQHVIPQPLTHRPCSWVHASTHRNRNTSCNTGGTITMPRQPTSTHPTAATPQGSSHHSPSL